MYTCPLVWQLLFLPKNVDLFANSNPVWKWGSSVKDNTFPRTTSAKRAGKAVVKRPTGSGRSFAVRDRPLSCTGGVPPATNPGICASPPYTRGSFGRPDPEDAPEEAGAVPSQTAGQGTTGAGARTSGEEEQGRRPLPRPLCHPPLREVTDPSSGDGYPLPAAAAPLHAPALLGLLISSLPAPLGPGGRCRQRAGPPPRKQRTAPATPHCQQVALPAAALRTVAAAPAGLAQPPGAGRSPRARLRLPPRGRASPARPPALRAPLRSAPRRLPRIHTHADTRGAAAAVWSAPALAATDAKRPGAETRSRRVPLPRRARLRDSGEAREVGEQRGEWRRPTASSGPCDSERRLHTRKHPPARSWSRCRAGQRRPAPSRGEPAWSESSVPPPGKAGRVTRREEEKVMACVLVPVPLQLVDTTFLQSPPEVPFLKPPGSHSDSAGG